MHITSIEPTPSPHTMKLNVNETLPAGTTGNYKPENKEEAPAPIQRLLEIEGIKGVYHVADFMALERHPKADWEQLLPQVRQAFGEEVEKPAEEPEEPQEAFGEVQAQVQMFKNIPMQIKLLSGEEEKRQGLPERFQTAAFEAQLEDDNIVMQRKWEDYGVRYGQDLEQIGSEMAEEIAAAYPDERLKRLVRIANTPEAENTEPKFKKVTMDMMEEPDWKQRYAAFDQMDPSMEDLPVIQKGLADEKPAIRRLAVVYLGMLEDSKVLPDLQKAMQDPSVTVRRTAADTYSDLGDPAGIPDMIEALKDKNKLVRWRAAMFLYEVGDSSAVEALKEADGDPEFEVDLQIKLALKRIEGGKEAKGSIWKQMSEKMEQERKPRS
ncbi:conserved virulence factor C family protein [Marinococcus halotolerans]|uniref:conserved virulence factor C family protein n=1 Tax=Marinococcus halotolerans TaxID=301092 RepID=UPI0003B5CAC7|nr:conserved virulence factor C family protein [Marinococcus halotolerans]